MGIAELVDDDEAIQLVKEDVGEQLAGEVADDDALAGRLVEEAFVAGELAPVGAFAADGDAVHGAVVDDFFPEIAEQAVELVAVFGGAADAVVGVGAVGVVELLV